MPGFGGEGGIGNCYLTDIRLSTFQGEKALETVAQQCECTEHYSNVHLEMVSGRFHIMHFLLQLKREKKER